MGKGAKKVVFVSNLYPDTSQPYRGLDNATVLQHLSQEFEIRAIALRPVLPLRGGRDWRPRQEDSACAPSFLEVPYVPKIGSRFNHLLMARRLRAALRKMREDFEFDLLLASWLYPDGCAVAMIARGLGVPVVLIAQGSDVHQYLKNRVRRRAILKAVGCAAATITRSRSLAELLVAAGADGERIRPIHNGADADIFHLRDRAMARRALNVAEGEKLLLFVGNLLPVKDPLMLIEAWAVHSERSGWTPRLVMAGSGSLEGAVLRRTDELGLSENLTLTGGITSTDVARWMGAADLLCMSSLNEGLPNVVIEALACGLRVLATDVGGIGELIDRPERGALVEPDDFDGYVARMSELLVSPRQRLHGDRCSSFSWERSAQEYRTVLEGALNLV